MGAITQIVAAKAALTATGFSTLASATYCVSNTYNASTTDPLDVMVEVECATTGTPAGNKQVVVFAQASYDNTNWQSGPTSGTTTTDEPDLTFLGTVPVNTATTTHRKSFSVAAAYGGVLPPYFRLVLKKDLGTALTSGAVSTAEVTGNAA